jgi:hypothetical protein
MKSYDKDERRRFLLNGGMPTMGRIFWRGLCCSNTVSFLLSSTLWQLNDVLGQGKRLPEKRKRWVSWWWEIGSRDSRQENKTRGRPVGPSGGRFTCPPEGQCSKAFGYHKYMEVEWQQYLSSYSFQCSFL